MTRRAANNISSHSMCVQEEIVSSWGGRWLQIQMTISQVIHAAAGIRVAILSQFWSCVHSMSICQEGEIGWIEGGRETGDTWSRVIPTFCPQPAWLPSAWVPLPASQVRDIEELNGRRQYFNFSWQTSLSPTLMCPWPVVKQKTQCEEVKPATCDHVSLFPFAVGVSLPYISLKYCSVTNGVAQTYQLAKLSSN